jgi:hypothetical protein
METVVLCASASIWSKQTIKNDFWFLVNTFDPCSALYLDTAKNLPID